jgi:transcription elongation factor GreB
VEVVAWAAGNGDRSDNADYRYSKRRLRQIDGRIRFLTKRIEAAEVVDPEAPRSEQAKKRAFLGATVRYASPFISPEAQDPHYGLVASIRNVM